MSDFQEIYLGSSISELTRKVRRNLLIFSISLFMILKGDMIPTTITPLGITISPDKQSILPNLLSLIVTYYMIKFFLYMMMDGKSLVYRAHKEEFPNERKDLDWKQFNNHISKNYRGIIQRHGWGIFIWVIARGILDVAFPLFTGGFVLWFYYNM